MNIVDTKLDKKDQLPVINEVSFVLLVYVHCVCEFQYSNPYWECIVYLVGTSFIYIL